MEDTMSIKRSVKEVKFIDDQSEQASPSVEQADEIDDQSRQRLFQQYAESQREGHEHPHAPTHEAPQGRSRMQINVEPETTMPQRFDEKFAMSKGGFSRSRQESGILKVKSTLSKSPFRQGDAFPRKQSGSWALSQTSKQSPRNRIAVLN